MPATCRLAALTLVVLAAALGAVAAPARGQESGEPTAPSTGVETALTGLTQVDAGVDSSCARQANGRVRCWGANGARQLGDGTTTPTSRPVLVKNAAGTAPMGNVIQVSQGGNHACAVLASRQVRCWGSNAEGGIGWNQAGSPIHAATVVGVETASLNNVRQVSAGFAHTCAVLMGGQVRCWGRNVEGQLGNGSNSDTSRPVAVEDVDGNGPLDGVVQVSAGKHFTCATFANGRIVCWGEGIAGQLGNDATSSSNLPVRVVGLSGSGFLGNAAEVQAGELHACARVNSGRVYCWGNDAFGELGNGTAPGDDKPVEVTVPGPAPLTRVTALGVGDDHGCARISSGRVRCWGRNDHGQLGDRTLDNRVRAVTMTNLSGTDYFGDAATGPGAMSGGVDHFCLRRAGAQVACVGHNQHGQLGDGTTQSTTRPVGVGR